MLPMSSMKLCVLLCLDAFQGMTFIRGYQVQDPNLTAEDCHSRQDVGVSEAVLCTGGCRDVGDVRNRIANGVEIT